MTSNHRITCRHGLWSSECPRCDADLGLDSAPRITHIEHADPGDEQADYPFPFNIDCPGCGAKRGKMCAPAGVGDEDPCPTRERAAKRTSEQPEHREFEAWAAVDRGGSANNVSLYREDCEWYIEKIAPLAGCRIVPCTVILKESAR